jgi:hypothetical protein
MKVPSLLACTLAAVTMNACLLEDGPVDDPDLVEPGTEPAYAPPPGKETNGPWLLGPELDVMEPSAPSYLNVSRTATSAAGQSVTVSLSGLASLKGTDIFGDVHVDDDPWFLGMRFSATPGAAQVKIVAVRLDGPVARYTLRFRPDTSTAWADVCEGGEAVVTTGRWRRDGAHVPAVDRLTFGCDGAAIMKCTLWGYGAGAAPAATPWRVHQACTRMLRNDRCGTGEPLTREGTTIEIYDTVNINAQPPASFPGVSSWPPPHDQMYFDAAFGPDGAVCLGKPRWQSLALDGDCPLVMPDPRVDVTASYCDENNPGGEVDGLIVTTAYYSEVGLHRWVKGSDQVATVRGYHAVAGEVPPFIGGYTYAGFDALLMRVLPTSVDPTEATLVNTYRGPGGDRVVTTVQPPGYVDEGSEGYVLDAWRENTRALYEYANAAGDERLSTTGSPPTGYTVVRLVGYVNAP